MAWKRNIWVHFILFLLLLFYLWIDSFNYFFRSTEHISYFAEIQNKLTRIRKTLWEVIFILFQIDINNITYYFGKKIIIGYSKKSFSICWSKTIIQFPIWRLFTNFEFNQQSFLFSFFFFFFFFFFFSFFFFFCLKFFEKIIDSNKIAYSSWGWFYWSEFSCFKNNC